MLEGLEVSEVLLNNLEQGFRIDAETYRPQYIEIEKLLNKCSITSIGDISKILKKGIFDIKAEKYTSEGIPFIRISNLKNMGIDTTEMVHIPFEENQKNLKTYLQKGDIILSKTAYPAASLVNIEHCNCSQDTIAIKLKDNSPIESSFLVTFLNTYYGKRQMARWFTGNIQMHLNLTDSKRIIIPLLSDRFQKGIGGCIEYSQVLSKSSKLQFEKSLRLLSKFIDIKKLETNKESFNVKSLSESFLKSKRLDAEYYLPKYEQVVNKITSQPHGRLEDLAKIVKSVEPGTANYSNEGVPFMRVSDYDKFGIDEPEVCIRGKYCIKNAKKVEKLKLKKGTVLLSKDGSVGIAYTIKRDREMLTSSAILHLKIKDKNKLLPEYLALVLNSKLTQMQAERDGGGSIILHWRMGDVKNVLIPVVDIEKQREVNDLVEESFKLKSQSEDLLETAKRAVEIAIEEDEEAAFAYINKKTEGITLSEKAIAE